MLGRCLHDHPISTQQAWLRSLEVRLSADWPVGGQFLLLNFCHSRSHCTKILATHYSLLTIRTCAVPDLGLEMVPDWDCATQTRSVGRASNCARARARRLASFQYCFALRSRRWPSKWTLNVWLPLDVPLDMHVGWGAQARAPLDGPVGCPSTCMHASANKTK